MGSSSLKAALDLDWDDPPAREQALVLVLGALEAVERWLETTPVGGDAPGIRERLVGAQQVRTHAVELAADQLPTLRRKVAKDRRISSEDAQMRHGRKSQHQRINAYKRHVLRDLDSGLVRAGGVTSANAPEASVTEAIVADLAHQPVHLSELPLDRAYLSSLLVRERPPDLTISCKAWPVRNGEHCTRTAFHLDWQRQQVRCPNHGELPFEPGGIVHVPAATCAPCPLRERCTTSVPGRSVAIHPDERLRLRTPSAPGDAAGTREAARKDRRGAWIGPHRAMAGAARPLSRQPEEPV